MIQLKLDLLQTLTLAALVYFGGIHLRKRVAWLDALNIPAAVLGGLLFTLLVLLLHDRVLNLQLDTALQPTLSVAFFTIFDDSSAEAAIGTIWSSSPCRISVGTSIFLRSSVRSVSENALMQK